MILLLFIVAALFLWGMVHLSLYFNSYRQSRCLCPSCRGYVNEPPKHLCWGPPKIKYDWALDTHRELVNRHIEEVQYDLIREMAREVFQDVRLDEGRLVSVTPKPKYAPLLAYCMIRQNVVGDARLS